eukprot:1678560-Prorocentrum_lima.AAC.1
MSVLVVGAAIHCLLTCSVEERDRKLTAERSEASGRESFDETESSDARVDAELGTSDILCACVTTSGRGLPLASQVT